jgi:hypothetical protein
MPRYDVTAWCSLPHYTTFEVEAPSIEEALAKARTQAADEPAQPCDGGSYEWDEFEIRSADDDGETICHLEPERAAEIAAPALLNAVTQGVIAARGVTGSWESGDLAAAVRALSLWLSDAANVIERAGKTTEGQP